MVSLLKFSLLLTLGMMLSQANQLTCPSGWIQHGEINNDISGCGMTRCHERYRQPNIEACGNKCQNTPGCKVFSWAPLGGDRHHLGNRVCSLYNHDRIDSSWGPKQILCKPAPIQAQCDASSIGGPSSVSANGIFYKCDCGKMLSVYRCINGVMQLQDGVYAPTSQQYIAQCVNTGKCQANTSADCLSQNNGGFPNTKHGEFYYDCECNLKPEGAVGIWRCDNGELKPQEFKLAPNPEFSQHCINAGKCNGTPPQQTEAPLPVLTCPSGWTQHGEINNDISGCGMTRCHERYRQPNIEACGNRCQNTPGCKVFSWAPLGGDSHHKTERVCSLYDNDRIDSTHGPKQILCKPNPTVSGAAQVDLFGIDSHGKTITMKALSAIGLIGVGMSIFGIINYVRKQNQQNYEMIDISEV